MCQIRLLNNRLLGEKYLGMRPIARYTISKNWIFPSPYEYDMFQKGTNQNVWWSCLWGWKFLRSEMKINNLRYVRSNICIWLVWNIFTWQIILRSAELRDLLIYNKSLWSNSPEKETKYGYYLIGPWAIWMGLKMSNFQSNFSVWWLGFILRKSRSHSHYRYC